MGISFRSAISVFIAFGLFAAGAAAAPPLLMSSSNAKNPWNSWLQLGLIGSNDLNRAEGELFLPNGNDTTLAFLDIRGNFFTEDNVSVIVHDCIVFNKVISRV